MKFIMSIDDSDENLFHGIRFTTENFEEIYVSSSYISKIEVTSIGLTDKEYENKNVKIQFNNSFIKEKTEAIERLQKRKDITYIDILCKNESNSIEIEVPYEDDELGFNKLQRMIEFGDGILLNIKKKESVLQ